MVPKMRYLVLQTMQYVGTGDVDQIIHGSMMGKLLGNVIPTVTIIVVHPMDGVDL